MKKNLLLTAVIAMFTGIISAQVPTLNLEAEYKFTGNTNDSSGHGYNGINSGAVLTQDRFGDLNSAYDFNAPGYIDCNNILNTTIAGTGNKMTISFWVKPSASNTNSVIIAKHADAGCSSNERQFFIRSFNNTVNVEYYGTVTGTSGRFVCGSTLMTDINKWYFVTVQYDGTVNTNNGLDRVKIFVDDLPETTTLSCRTQAGTFPFNIATGPAHFAIGNYVTSGGSVCLAASHYKGKIDDIRIYSRLLSASEISSLYNENTTGIASYSNKTAMSIYPNPASEIVTIELKGLMQKSEVRIENSLGELVYSQPVSVSESSIRINTAGFAQGIYFIRVIAQNEVMATEKLIIQ